MINMEDPIDHLVTVNDTNHHGYLINKLWEFMQNKHKTDMCILSNGQMIQAHQLILEVFTSQEQLGYAALHDNSSNLDKIMEFMYTGVIRVQPEDLDSLLHLASDLGFAMLVDALKTAKSSSSQIYPVHSEHENSDIMPYALVDSDNDAFCDSIPPAPIIPTLEHKYSICRVKQEPINQSISEHLNLSDTQNVVGLENWECQFVDSLEIHEEATDIVKHESNVDIGACSLNMVEPGLSDGHPPVTAMSESISNCVNPTPSSRFPQCKRTRTNNTECGSLLDPDWKGSTNSKGLSTRAGAKSQLSTRGQILPSNASAVGLAKTCNQRKLKNPGTFCNENAAKCSESNHKVVINRIVETKCVGGNERKTKLIPKIKCSVCSKILGINKLKRHMRIHTGERPFACPQCSKTFSHDYSMSRHMLVHTGERPFACPQCPKTFSYSSSLSLHIRIHTGEHSFTCPQCPRTFCDHSALSRHMNVHTRERPFACSQCTKTFSVGYALSRHMLVHTGERPYACPQCPKTFSQSFNLSLHIRSHTGDRRYACRQCPKTFTQSSHLSIHMRIHNG